jgi:hypothetical protein
MSDPNYENFEGGGWDDQSREPVWGEHQWRNYLKSSDRDSAKFLSIYNSLKHKPNHLDEVASLMGWDAQDLSMTDEFSAIEVDVEPSNQANDLESAPYTLHKHPVYVVTRSLYRYLHQSWEHFMTHSESTVPPLLCWRYANSLHQAEMNVLLSIQSLDLGDYGLAICHLKNSLTSLNFTLTLLDQLSHNNQQFLHAFQEEIRIRLFDLRELWLRVMQDCRIEAQRKPNSEDEQD